MLLIDQSGVSRQPALSTQDCFDVAHGKCLPFDCDPDIEHWAMSAHIDHRADNYGYTDEQLSVLCCEHGEALNKPCAQCGSIDRIAAFAMPDGVRIVRRSLSSD